MKKCELFYLCEVCAGDMFCEIIARWLNLASRSDDYEVRIGRHNRHSEWPKALVCAENERVRSDNILCRWTALRITDNENLAMAFAMATHPRLGAKSAAFMLVSDVLRQILVPDIIVGLEQLYVEYMFLKFEDTRNEDCVRARCFNGNQSILHGPNVSGGDHACRFMVRSELEHRDSHKWENRANFFFNRRGWFCGVDMQYAPEDMNISDTITGIFESVPHIFCDTWFPICRPHVTCRHLIHVTSHRG